jgi:hypothetical protein
MGWAVIVFAVLVALLWTLFDPDERRRKSFELQLTVREPVNDSEVHQRFFGSNVPCTVAGSVRRILATHTGYPAAKILPDDDLIFFWRELDLVRVFNDLEEEFNIRITQSDIRRCTCTLRSFVDLVVRLSNSPSAA